MLNQEFLNNYLKSNNIPVNPRRNLTEYLQSEILNILYSSKYGRHLSFLGGTCLRFVYRIERFSEDLDFDLIKKGLNYDKLADLVEKRLAELGFKVETKVKKTAKIVIILVKISEMMEQLKIVNQKTQKLKIKLEVDFSPSKFIKAESIQIASFGKVFNVIANSLPTIFAQKIVALKYRPYQKGRDFYDLIWFLLQGNIEPEYKILKEKGILAHNRETLVKAIKKLLQKMNLKQAKKDVEPFLFNPRQSNWILEMDKYLEKWGSRNE